MVRLTINLNDEVYRVAKSMAIADDCSLSAAVNKLLQRGISGPPAKKKKNSTAFPTVRGRQPFTSGDVYKIDQL